MKRHSSKNQMLKDHRIDERENLAHPSHPVLGHGQDGPRQVPLTLSEATEQANAHDQYIVPVHIVFLHQTTTDGMPEPAQIPWLEEIRSDQYLSDLHSEVI